MRIAISLVAGMTLLATTVATQAQSYGFATYSALIASNGTTVRSSGVGASTKLGGSTVGKYNVTFARPVNTCSFVVSLATGVAGYAEAANLTGDNNTLRVSTFNGSGTATNFPFAVIVTCAS